MIQSIRRYSNGGFGYMPVSCAFEQGGYEPNASPFAPQAAEVTIKEGLKLLQEMAEA